jgi:hypothetical protein
VPGLGADGCTLQAWFKQRFDGILLGVSLELRSKSKARLTPFSSSPLRGSKRVASRLGWRRPYQPAEGGLHSQTTDVQASFDLIRVLTGGERDWDEGAGDWDEGTLQTVPVNLCSCASRSTRRLREFL